MAITVTKFDVLERITVRYRATLIDDNGTAVPGTSLTTITLTVYDKSTGNILNNRNDQNVLNQNNVTIDSNGLLEWIVQPEDLAIVNTNHANEIHVALFEWTWQSGTRSGKHEMELIVKNLTKVP